MRHCATTMRRRARALWSGRPALFQSKSRDRSGHVAGFQRKSSVNKQLHQLRWKSRRATTKLAIYRQRFVRAKQVGATEEELGPGDRGPICRRVGACAAAAAPGRSEAIARLQLDTEQGSLHTPTFAGTLKISDRPSVKLYMVGERKARASMSCIRTVMLRLSISSFIAVTRMVHFAVVACRPSASRRLAEPRFEKKQSILSRHRRCKMQSSSSLLDWATVSFMTYRLRQWFLTGSPEGMQKCFLLTLRCINNNHFDPWHHCRKGVPKPISGGIGVSRVGKVKDHWFTWWCSVLFLH